jgi:hypothetical protein
MFDLSTRADPKKSYILARRVVLMTAEGKIFLRPIHVQLLKLYLHIGNLTL